jgi:polysaccharide export outer membrane protein
MRLLQFFTVITFIFLFSSCKVFKSNLMLKTPRNYSYDKIVDSLSAQDYRIAANDVLQLRIFSNDGFKIIDLSPAASNFASVNTDYTVERDGYIKLPIVGRTKISGLTVREIESYLEQIYTEYYVKPFIIVKVVNKRVIVFPGNGGLAQVLPLVNNNTTVLEAIALSGGISQDGKAYKVKLIRTEGTSKPKVYLMDLSTIDGISAGNTTVLANDIIYIEPRYRVASTLVGELAPVIALISSTFVIYSLIIRK